MQPDLFSGIQAADGEAIDLSLPVLSILQPWATSIVCGLKDVENRTWPTRVRGRVLIHAGKRRSLNELMSWQQLRKARGIEDKMGRHWNDLEFGGIIGMAEIVDCVEELDSPWFTGPFGFVLRNARPLPFYPCKGKLGFFRVRKEAL